MHPTKFSEYFIVKKRAVNSLNEFSQFKDDTFYIVKKEQKIRKFSTCYVQVRLCDWPGGQGFPEFGHGRAGTWPSLATWPNINLGKTPALSGLAKPGNAGTYNFDLCICYYRNY